MAFPDVVDADTVRGGGSTGTSHAITLPANRSNGNRILVFFSCNNNATVTGWPSGWNVIITQRLAAGAATVDTLVVAEKIISGGETNFSLSTGGLSTLSYYHAYRITGAHASTLSAGVGVNGGTTTIVFPTLDPSGWALEDTLWFIGGINDNGTRTVSTWPSDYTGARLLDGSGAASAGVALATAYHTEAVASESPGTLTWSAGPNTAGVTIAIMPASAVVTPPTGDGDYYNFTGTNGAAWPSPWTSQIVGGSGTATIQSNRGRLATDATAWSQIRAKHAVSSDDIEVCGLFYPGSLLESYPSVRVRNNSASSSMADNYFLAFYPHSGTASIIKRVSDVETTIAGPFSYTYVVGEAVGFRFEVIGNTIQARIWNPTSTEPGTWTMSVTNSEIAGGDEVVLFNISPGNSSYVEFDDVTVTQLSVKKSYVGMVGISG
jgi:hypothetical protein